MHELSIVQNILEITEKEVLKAKATKVEQIDLDVGMLSGIEMQALLFAWEACVPGTVLAGARRQIRRIPAKAKCVQCENIFDTQNFFDPCPNCGAWITELVQGKELKIKSLTIS